MKAAESCLVSTCHPIHNSHQHLSLQVDDKVVQMNQRSGPIFSCMKG